jgi:SnoaL-like domain
MEESTAVTEGLRSFYERFSSHDPDLFASALATGDGVSVIGSAPGEGHNERDSWVDTYAKQIPEAGLRLEGGGAPRGYVEGTVGFAVDEPRFVLPDGHFLPTRLTAVLRQEAGEWKVVHLHFSVGVPDDQAVQAP